MTLSEIVGIAVCAIILVWLDRDIRGAKPR